MAAWEKNITYSGHFFENSPADPDFSLNSKRYVDKHINNYKAQIRRTRNKEPSRNRRSVNENGAIRMDSVDLKEFSEIPVKNCLDLVLFEQQGLWYAASVENNGNTLNIWKYEEDKFSLLDTKTVVKGTKLDYLQLDSASIIAIAENRAPKEHFENQSSIYRLENNNLEVIQKINESFSEDLASSDRTENISIYKWVGKHFDVIQTLEAAGSFKVSPFSIEHSHFLALAHGKSNDLQLYRPFQKIPVYVCSDIKHFPVRFGNIEEHFLIAANFYKIGHKSYNTVSVIYKYIEDYFIPFQTVRINGIKQIEPVMVDGDTVLLVLALDGVKALHYDGWIFVEKNVTLWNSERKLTNVTAIKSYHFQNKNVIVLLEENSTSSRMYEMTFAFVNNIEDEYDEMLSWCQSNLKKEVPSLSQEGVSEIDNLVLQLKSYEKKLSETSNSLNELLQINRTHIITQNITANEMFLANKSTVESPNIDSINDIDIQALMSNTININEGFEIKNLTFDSVRVEEPIHPKRINHHDGILHRNRGIVLDKLNINGSATFKEKLITQNFQTLNLKIRRKAVRHSFKTIQARRVTVEGFVNDLDVPTLDKYAFRKSGGFSSTKTCIFDDLTANNLDTRTLSGKLPENIVSTIGKNYTLNKNVIFHNGLDVNNLQIHRHLNNISVHNGKLDVLLKNTTASQYISGVKSFQNLKLLNEIDLQGKIVGKQFEDINPLIKVDEDVLIEGDVTIIGNVTAEELFKSKDMMPRDSNNSISRLSRLGLLLNSTEITLPLKLQQHVKVKDINVESVNSLDIRSLVISGADRSQVITGKKVFLGDLEINGDSKVSRINVISAPTVVHGNIKIRNAEIENMTVNGFVNNVNLSKVLQDAVLKSNLPLKVLGEKMFKNLHVQNLNVASLEELLKALDNGEVQLVDAKNLRNVTANRVHFEKSLNGLDKDELQIPKDEIIVIEGVEELGALKVFGKMFVKSNRLGHVNLKELVEDTIKIDEEGHFHSASFKHIRVDNGIDLMGEIENLDLDNIWQNGIEEPQNITDKKFIRGKIIAEEGNVLVRNQINGNNISEFCKFITDDIGKVLFVKGNVTFAKGPNVLNLNGHDLGKISKSVWFVDQPTVFNDGVQFGNVTFKDSVNVDGLLNDVDLRLLSTKYLSKTKNQSIPGAIVFSEDVIFEDDVAAPDLTISGTINNLDIQYFMKNGEFLLNGLNPATDIMRFDKENKIVGPKRFKNLNIDNLHLPRNVTIQDVNVDRWLKKAMLNTGTFKISGRKSIGNATFLKELGVAGKLNGGKFSKESIMTTSMNQNIEGKKVFRPQNPRGIRFKSLKVKGLINDTDIMDLVRNQASKNGDNIFTSEVNFTDVVKAKNVNFDKLYKGVNISELVANITHLGSLDHLSDYYWNLLNRSDKIEKSLKYYILKLGPPLAYVTSIQYFGSDYIYMENEDVHRHLSADHTHIGSLLHFGNATEFHSSPFLTRGTLFLESFFLADTREYCLLFIDYNLTTSILCSLTPSQFYVRQHIVDEKAHMASILSINNCTYLITISSSSNEAFNGSRTAIWKMTGPNFEVYQSIYRGNPISVSSVSYNQKHFLAVAYLRFEETMYFGMIEIFKFDGASQKFMSYQIIQLATPVQVSFSVLPSDELVLYVVTEDTGVEAFNVYIYEGIFGFNPKVKQSILSRITGIDRFSINDKHFVVAKYKDAIGILEAVFKGHKIE
nr:unnamed protein product [Callosobruchus analis]